MRAKADTYNDETRVKHTVRDWIVFMLFWIINVIVVATGGGGGRGGLWQALCCSHQGARGRWTSDPPQG